MRLRSAVPVTLSVAAGSCEKLENGAWLHHVLCICMTASANDLCRAMFAFEGMLSLWNDMLWADAGNPPHPFRQHTSM